MVQVNNTRDKTHSLKKSRSVASAVLDFSDIPLAADDYELFNIPDDAIITDTFIHILTAADALSTLAIGFDGGVELLAAGNIAVVGVVAANNLNLASGTGKRVTVNPSINLTQGKIVVVVEYVEYNLANGDLTKLSATV